MTTTVPTESAVAEPPSNSVVAAVADAKGVSPIDMQPPLYEAVDPEALDRLFETRDGAARELQVSFRYSGFDVTVEGSGEVAVEDADADAETLSAE